MRILTLLLAAIVASNCGRASPSPRATVRDSAGITLIDLAAAELLGRAPAELAEQPLPGTQPEFGDVADVAPGPDGRMIVLDPLGPSVVVLDSTGAEVSRFGRDGNGPGEFRGAGVSNVVSSADSIYVPDLINQRLTVFDHEGTVLRSRALDLSSGLLLDWRAAPAGGMQFRRMSEPQRIEWLRDDSATVLASLQSLNVPASAGPLAAIPVWCVFPNGRVAMARTDVYDVSVIDGSATVTRLRSTGAPERLRDEDVEHVKRLMLEAMERIPADQVSPELVERMLAGVMFPERAPRIAGLACPVDDQLWVQRAAPVTEMDREVLRVGSARAYGGPRWDVWDLRSGEVHPVTTGDGTRVTRVSANSLVGFSMDALGRKRVARWRPH